MLHAASLLLQSLLLLLSHKHPTAIAAIAAQHSSGARAYASCSAMIMVVMSSLYSVMHP